MRLIIALLLLLCPLAMADAAPSPPPPAVKVVFLDGASPYQGDLRAWYVCDGHESGDGTPADELEMELSCEDGVCWNEAWFYKHNPCYRAERGSVLYSLADQPPFATGPLDLAANGRHITIDVSTSMVSQRELGLLEGPCCLPMLLLPALTLLCWRVML